MKLREIILAILGSRVMGTAVIRRKAHVLTTCSIVWTALSLLAIILYGDGNRFGLIAALSIWIIHGVLLLGAVLCWLFEKKTKTVLYEGAPVDCD